MTTPVMVIREDHELLAVLPFQLGFVPEASIVVVSLQGPRRRLGVMIRADLSDLTGPDGARVTDAILAALRGDGAAESALVIYSDDALAGSQLHPDLAKAVAGLERAIGASGIGNVSWLIDRDSFWRAAPQATGGRVSFAGPRSELDGGATAHTLRPMAGEPAPSRDDVVSATIAPEPARRQAMRAAATSWRSREDHEATWQLAALTQWREALAGTGRLRPQAIGHLAAGLRDIRVRDAVMAALVPGCGTAPEQSLVAGQDAGILAAYEAVTNGSARLPGPVLARARELSSLVAAHAARRQRAPALTLWAWLEWWDGEPIRAGVLLDRAAADDPGYTLAGLLREVAAAGIRPGWAKVETPAGR